MEIKEFFKDDGKTLTLTLGIDALAGRLLLKAPVFVDTPAGPETVLQTLVELDTRTMEFSAGVPEIGKLLKVDLQSITLDPGNSLVRLGGNAGGEGRLEVLNKVRAAAILAEGETGTLTIGARKSDGLIEVKNKDDVVTARIVGRHGNLELGADGADGDITLKNADGDEAINLNGNAGAYSAGGNGRDSSILLKKSDGVATVNIDGRHGNMVLGGAGADGDITLRSEGNQDIIRMDAQNGNVIVGGVGVDGNIIIRNSSDVDRIRITGDDGDIRFLGADLAEEFQLGCKAAVPEPGTVMVLDDEGNIEPCHTPADQRVVGVIAGAGEFRPALVLDQQGGDDRLPVAMVGKAYCKVSSVAGPISVGDLLTTSEITGHAQKVTDAGRSVGRIIGKALAPMNDQSGLIPIIVNLQ